MKRIVYTSLFFLFWIGVSKLVWADMSPAMIDKLADAIYQAEGSEKAIKPFGILSVHCDGYEDCRSVCKNTIRNNYQRWLKSDRKKTYLEFLADRYAPAEAHKLNKNWLGNVQRIFWES